MKRKTKSKAKSRGTVKARRNKEQARMSKDDKAFLSMTRDLYDQMAEAAVLFGLQSLAAWVKAAGVSSGALYNLVDRLNAGQVPGVQFRTIVKLANAVHYDVVLKKQSGSPKPTLVPQGEGHGDSVSRSARKSRQRHLRRKAAATKSMPRSSRG